MSNKFYKILFMVSVLVSFYGCSTINESLEETDKTLKNIETKGSGVVNSVFGERTDSK